MTVHVAKLVFPKAYTLAFETAQREPVAGPGQILIRTHYSLISPGTELALYTGTHIDIDNPDNQWAKLPFYPGYASVGEVVKTGEGVCGFSPGDLVFAVGHHASHDWIRNAEDQIMKLPEKADPVHMLFARLAEISASALIHSRFRADSIVAVLGMGLIGNLAGQLYALQGARVIGIDVVDERLQIARRCGIAEVIRSGTHVDLADEISRLTGGREPDVVVEATGNPALVNVGLELVRRRGQVILLGSPRGTAEIDIYRHIHRKGAALIGAHAGIKGIDGLPTSAELLRYVSRLIVAKQLAVEPLITHILPYDQAKSAYDELLGHKDRTLGVVLDWRHYPEQV